MGKKKNKGKSKRAAQPDPVNETVSNESKATASNESNETVSNETVTNEAASKETTPKLSRGRRWAHVALAALGGAFQCLGFAGFSMWPFALISFLPMMWLLDQERGASTKRVLALGLVHGTVGYTGGYYWLVDMLANFSGYEGAMNWLFASVFFVYQGGQQMLIYWLYKRSRDRGAGPTLAAVPALLSLELLYPVLFPAFLATGFHNATWLIQVADLGGPMFLSAVVMAFNGALYESLVWLKSAKADGAAFPKRSVGIAAAAVLFTIAYGGYRVSEVDARAAAADKALVGMVQVNMGIFEKRDEPFEGHRRHLAQSQQLIEELAAEGKELDLLVWPESAYTFFLPDNMTNLRRRVMGPVEVPTLFGGLASRETDGERRHYNTAYLVDENADIVGTYDKTYLLAFGEYLPLGETFPILYEWSPNSGHFTPGDHVRGLELGDLRISTLICYEDVLPSFTRSAVREANPNLLVNITNDAWFGDTHEPWIHLALAKFRAVEHHRALARSTNSGVTAFVDPAGRALETIPFGERAQIAEELPLMDGATLYGYAGDWPGWLGFASCIFLAFVRRRR